MNSIELSLTWNGDQWEVAADGPSLSIPPGTTVTITIPVLDRANGEAPRYDGPTMLESGSFVYLSIAPGGDDVGAWQLWEDHRRTTGLRLSRPPKRPLVPIRLEEDLRLLGGGRDSLAPCRCSIGSQEFTSLNRAGSSALAQWSGRIANTLSVFNELKYRRGGHLTSLSELRDNLLKGTPFRTENDEDLGPELFDTFAV